MQLHAHTMYVFFYSRCAERTTIGSTEISIGRETAAKDNVAIRSEYIGQLGGRTNE